MTFTITARGAFHLKALYLTDFPLQESYLSDFPGPVACLEVTLYHFNHNSACLQSAELKATH